MSRRCQEWAWTVEFLAHDTDADLVTNTALMQKLHSAVEARQVSHEAPEPHAVNCALEDLNANGLGRVLLTGDAGSAVQTLVEPAFVGRGERTTAEKSSKCSHQYALRKIESPAKTCVRVFIWWRLVLF